MLNKFRESAKKVKQVFYNRYFATSEELEVKEAFKERKLAFYFLVVSAVVLLLKFSAHRVGNDHWIDYLYSGKQNFVKAISAVFAFLLSLEWIATPIFSGLAMAVIMWCTVYLDSYIPGVFPPSPLSPKKSRVHARTFHMGYYLAVINGILIAAVMLHANLTHPSK